MPPMRVLVANRGEIAIRVCRATKELGETAIAVYTKADEHSLHRYVADEAYLLSGSDPVAPYLNVAGIVALAKEVKAHAVHPGYGFLSENGDLARALAVAGIAFIGPTALVLDLFGSKTAARELAVKCGVPVVPGSEGAVVLEQAQAFVARIGLPVILKAVKGGGGRGMRVVRKADQLAEAFTRCSSEALAAFGDGSVFVEQYMERPRHIEVQILGDHAGNIVILGERECSIQQSHQKVIEIAPCPSLSAEMRRKLVADALNIAMAVDYTNAGTVEFLVDDATGKYAFIEVNPRIQVEHTVTEEMLGIDLVQAQICIMNGEILSNLNLSRSPPVKGFAIQCRVNTTSAGTLTEYQPPSGVGIRVDGYGYRGYTVLPFFDSLLAKVIVRAASFPAAVAKATDALREFRLDGVKTNLDFLLNILAHPAFVSNKIHTHFLLDYASDLSKPVAAGRLPLPASIDKARSSETKATTASAAVPPGGTAITAAIAGQVVEIRVKVGDYVKAGDSVAIMSAMKMESAVHAAVSGRVVAIHASIKAIVAAGDVLLSVAADSSTSTALARLNAVTSHLGSSWQKEIEELELRKGLAKNAGGEGLKRQKAAGKMTARERIAVLLDPDTFVEYGTLAGRARYDEDGKITGFTPGNTVAGRGKIHGRSVMVSADDFTVRGGHADGAVMRKQPYGEQLAREFRVPVVRLLDGSSGGGSVTLMLEAKHSYMPLLNGVETSVKLLSEVPIAAALLGPVVGFGAARAVLSHFSVMVKTVAQLFVAGPPVVEHAQFQKLTKEELGGVAIHGSNGSIDNLAESEHDALNQVKAFLSYLPTNAWTLPPRVAATDSPSRTEEELLSIIPREAHRTYEIRRVIELLVDQGSFFAIGRSWGRSTVCGFARFNGCPVGLVANDCQFDGGSLTSAASDKMKRHVELCDTFHLPVVSLVDQPGFTVGLQSEKEGAIRHGGALIASLYRVAVPWFSVILRRVYGVAGAALVDRGDPDVKVSWPSGDWGSLPIQGGLEAAFKAQLQGAKDPEQLKQQLLRKLEAVKSPFRTAEAFGVEEIIDPRQTRPLICDWVELAYTKLAHADYSKPRYDRFSAS